MASTAGQLARPGTTPLAWPTAATGPALTLVPGRRTAPGPLGDGVASGYRHELAVVVLTQATRPAELERALASVRLQQGVDLQLVLVLNGAAPADVDLPRLGVEDHLIVLPENLGIPGGRNVGAAAADARLLMFLDDDAELLGPGVLASALRRFDGDPGLGAMAIRLVDEDGRTQRRHVPRVGGGSAQRSGEVTHFIGAACAVRADAFYALDGFDRQFFYAMEESDLSWRLLDAGWSIWYSADLTAFHPRTTPSRHAGHVVLTARNRMWAALRSLPFPVCVAYVLTWTLVAVARGNPVRQVLTGYRQAWLARPERRPMRWRTILRMTRLGRPPVL